MIHDKSGGSVFAKGRFNRIAVIVIPDPIQKRRRLRLIEGVVHIQKVVQNPGFGCLEMPEPLGKLTAGLVDLTWYPTRHFGASIGYHIWDLGVKVDRNRLTGKIDYEYEGPKLTLGLRF